MTASLPSASLSESRGAEMKRTKTQHDKVTEAMERKVDFRRLEKPGSYDDVQTKAARQLACEIHWSESDDVSISWSALERAQNIYNEQGLAATLDMMFDLQAKRTRRGK